MAHHGVEDCCSAEEDGLEDHGTDGDVDGEEAKEAAR